VETITVGVGDCKVSTRRDCLLVTHGLGSCIAVVMHDPVVPVGGLLHFLLPISSLDRQRASVEPCMFADTGIRELLRQVSAAGGDPKRASVRLVGGALVMDPKGIFQIGKKNYEACRQSLAEAGISVQGEATGGTISRTVRLHVGTGVMHWTTGGGEPVELPAWSRGGGAPSWRRQVQSR
jgi:chemotaxis protein CheD